MVGTGALTGMAHFKATSSKSGYPQCSAVCSNPHSKGAKKVAQLRLHFHSTGFSVYRIAPTSSTAVRNHDESVRQASSLQANANTEAEETLDSPCTEQHAERTDLLLHWCLCTRGECCARLPDYTLRTYMTMASTAAVVTYSCSRKCSKSEGTEHTAENALPAHTRTWPTLVSAKL
jgi:hypothetical protein